MSAIYIWSKWLLIVHGQSCCISRTIWSKWLLIVHGQSCFISRTMDRCLQFIYGQNGYLLYMDRVAASAEPLWSKWLLIVHGQSCFISRTMDRCLQFIYGQNDYLLYMDKAAASAEPWTGVCNLYMVKMVTYCTWTKLLHQQNHGQVSAIYTWSKWLLIVYGQSCCISRTMGWCLQFIYGQNGYLLYMKKAAASANHGQVSAIYTWSKWLLIVHCQSCFIRVTMDNVCKL